MIHWSNTLKSIKADLGAGFVSTDTAQDITGKKTLIGTDEMLNLKAPTGATPAMYVSYYAGNTRLGYMGYTSSSNNDFEINNNASGGVIKLTATKTQVYNPLELGTTIRAGYGAGTIKFTPEDNSSKIINMYDSDIGANCYFTLDMGNKGTVRGLKQPTADNEAATKIYVDSKVQTLVVDKANITIKRVNTVEQTADTAGGKYLKFETTNQALKTFIQNARNAKKVIYFNISYGTNNTQFTDISLFGGGNDILAVAIPPFWSNAEADTFVNKSTISNITIRAIG